MDSATTLILAGVIILQSVGLILREWQNWKDRKDLLDRMMSAGFQEYKTLTNPKKPPPRRVFPGNMTDEEMAAADKKLREEKEK